MRNAVLWSVLGVILAIANGAIIGKEQILTEGETMLLQLAPRDPRSLMQGDYMTLNYRIATEVAGKSQSVTDDGHIVVALDEHRVTRLLRIHDEARALSDGEYVLRYRKRHRDVRLATNAFYFQEGHADNYRTARYGELRVNDDGDAVLVGLRDDNFRPLGPGGLHR